MWNSRLNETQAGIKIARGNIHNLRYAGDTILMAESEKELKSFLRVKEESEKAGLKLNIQITKKKQTKKHWDPVPSLHGKQKGKKRKQWQILFS